MLFGVIIFLALLLLLFGNSACNDDAQDNQLQRDLNTIQRDLNRYALEAEQRGGVFRANGSEHTTRLNFFLDWRKSNKGVSYLQGMPEIYEALYWRNDRNLTKAGALFQEVMTARLTNFLLNFWNPYWSRKVARFAQKYPTHIQMTFDKRIRPRDWFALQVGQLLFQHPLVPIRFQHSIFEYFRVDRKGNPMALRDIYRAFDRRLEKLIKSDGRRPLPTENLISMTWISFGDPETFIAKVEKLRNLS